MRRRTSFRLIAGSIVLITGFMLSGHLRAQSIMDSLKLALMKTPYGPEKFSLYKNIAWEYVKLRTPDGVAGARQYADSIHLLAEKLNDNVAMTLSHFYYGMADKQQGNYSKSIDHFREYVKGYVAKGDSINVAHGLYQLGVINQELGNYETSLAIFYRILKIYEAAHIDRDVSNTMNSIGIIFKDMKRYDEAIAIYNKAHEISTSGDANVFANLANLYAEQDDYEKAMSYFRKTLKLFKERNDQWGMAMNFENIGNMLIKMEQYDSALYYQLRALSIRKELAIVAELGTSYEKVGYTYFKLNHNDRALENYSKSLAIAGEVNQKALLRDLYGDLSELYSARRDFARALHYEKLYDQENDSLLNESTVKQLNELQAKYDTEKKDKQILVLAKEEAIQKNETQRQVALKKLSVMGLLLVALLAVVIGLVSWQRQKNQKLINKIKEANFKRQVSELEMKALRAQINPNFLYNCMNSIDRMILEGDGDNASRYLTKFSKLVRLMLENAESAVVSLQNELALLESYIQLEELRFDGEINYQITVEEGIDAQSVYLPSMVIQPFVENAIWQGLFHKKGGMLKIEITEKNERLFLSIEDNGVGRKQAGELAGMAALKTTSMGMNVTKERLQLLNPEETNELITITDLKDISNRAIGTRVEIAIPVPA